MRSLSSFTTSLMLLAAFAACGDDGGAADDATDDTDQSDEAPDDTADDTDDTDDTVPDAAPDAPDMLEANCDPLDLAQAADVPLTSGTVTPNPQAGTVVAGTYELTSVRLEAPVPVTGTAAGRVEIVVGGATAGAARVALAIDGMALGQAVMENVTGAGLYTITGTDLTVADGCGGMEPLPVLEYTATATQLTLWTEYMITDPITTTIPLELVLDLEQ